MKIRTLSSLFALATFATSLPLGVSAAPSPPLAAAAAPSPSPKAVEIPTPEPAVTPVTPTVAPGYAAPNAAPKSANIIGVTQQPFVGISLNDAIGMALLKNANLAVSSSDTRIANYQIRAVKGLYDVHFLLEPSIKHDITAPNNAFFAGPNFTPIEQNYWNIQAGVSGIAATGGSYNVSITQNRINDNTAVLAFNPYYLASLNVSVTQPLLKGFGPNSDVRRQLYLSEANDYGSQATTFVNASSTIATVADTYWDLVQAWRNVAIQEEALHQAILQQASNVRLARRGAAAPIDAVESSTQVATFQDDVYSALQSVASLQNSLKSLIVNDPGDPVWMANLVPTSPVEQLPSPPSLPEVLTTAMANRPELHQVVAQQREADINLGYAKNQKKPQVDLQLNYQGNGLAGNALPPLGGVFGSATPPPYLDGRYGTAYGNIGRFPTYQAGVLITQPIGNNTAKANLAIAEEQEREVKIQSQNTDQRILAEVRNAIQTYQSSLSRLYAARKAREAAQQVYDSEQRKFRNGESTTFLVTQRHLELVQDQGRELLAQTDLNKSIIELQRSDGTILSVNNVTLNKLGQGAVTP